MIVLHGYNSPGLILQGWGQFADSEISGRYTNIDELYRRFGKENIEKWSTINAGALRPTTIRAAIEDAEDYVDDALRNGVYDVPFVGSVPSAITRVATWIAGVNLYEARGVVDVDPSTGRAMHRLAHHMKKANKHLAMIKRGALDLNYERRKIRAGAIGEIISDEAETTLKQSEF